MVSDPAGNFAGANNSSRDISNDYDYQALVGLRQAADGILTTAKTARVEQYRRSRFAPLAIISRSGNFSGIPAVEQEQSLPTNSDVYLMVHRRLVKSTRLAYPASWIRVVSIGSGSPFAISFRLSRMGWRHILAETGPTFSKWLISKSIIKTLALTITNTKLENPLDACRSALAELGVGGATLDSADQIEDTLFTSWSQLQPIRSR